LAIQHLSKKMAVYSEIIRKFRMECRCHDIIFFHINWGAIDHGEHLDLRACLLYERRPDEYKLLRHSISFNSVITGMYDKALILPAITIPYYIYVQDT